MLFIIESLEDFFAFLFQIFFFKYNNPYINKEDIIRKFISRGRNVIEEQSFT